MKRSLTDDNHSHDNSKKFCTPTERSPQQQQDSTHSFVTMSAIVLNHVHDIIRDLDQGHLDHCLSKQLTRDTLDNLQPADAELASTLDAALKNIAQRQLMLETDNLRYRIAIQQQYQLLTAAQGDDDKATTKNNANNSEEQQLPKPTKTTSKVTTKSDEQYNNDNNLTTTTKKIGTTSEDGLSTIKDSSLLEKMQPHNRSPMLSMPTSTTPTGYFCKYLSFSFFYSILLYPVTISFVCRQRNKEEECLCT